MLERVLDEMDYRCWRLITCQKGTGLETSVVSRVSMMSMLSRVSIMSEGHLAAMVLCFGGDHGAR